MLLCSSKTSFVPCAKRKGRDLPGRFSTGKVFGHKKAENTDLTLRLRLVEVSPPENDLRAYFFCLARMASMRSMILFMRVARAL